MATVTCNSTLQTSQELRVAVLYETANVWGVRDAATLWQVFRSANATGVAEQVQDAAATGLENATSSAQLALPTSTRLVTCSNATLADNRLSTPGSAQTSNATASANNVRVDATNSVWVSSSGVTSSLQTLRVLAEVSCAARAGVRSRSYAGASLLTRNITAATGLARPRAVVLAVGRTAAVSTTVSGGSAASHNATQTTGENWGSVVSGERTDNATGLLQVATLGVTQSILQVGNVTQTLSHAWVTSGASIMASVTFGPEGQVMLAHGEHTLPAALWAEGGVMRTPSGGLRLHKGDPLRTTFHLGDVSTEDNRLVALDELWLTGDIPSETIASDGAYDRSPIVRGEQARFRFGKGAFKREWDITVRGFTRIEAAQIRTRLSRTRY